MIVDEKETPYRGRNQVGFIHISQELRDRLFERKLFPLPSLRVAYALPQPAVRSEGSGKEAATRQ